MATQTIRRKRSTTTFQQKNEKVFIQFDVGMLNALIKFCLCDHVTRSRINSLYKLMKEASAESYKNNPDIADRVIILQKLTEAIIEKNISDMDLLHSDVMANCGDAVTTLGKINLERNQLSVSDTDVIAENIDIRLQSVCVYQKRQSIIDDMMALDSLKCVSYFEIIDRLKKNLSDLLGNLMSQEKEGALLRSFSFSDANVDDMVNKIVTNLQKPTAILQTGIRALNRILAPGFQGGRLYCFIGCTGKFKSGTLINLADQIRKFNPQIKAVENGRRKTVLYVTMENSVNETVERIVDMYSDIDDDILDMTTEQVLQVLREKGKFVFTDTEGIDIDIRYYPNLEICVADLAIVYRELLESGKDPIAIILDYIARIESNQPNNGDERLRISYAAKNLHSLAEELNIPIITAMQVNREGNAILDAAMRENKQDLAQLIGPSNVGLAWSLNEEVDWLCFIYPERQKVTGQLFLSFKLWKIRGKQKRKAIGKGIEPYADYFNHPFENEKEIMLATDVDKEVALSIISLKTDLVNDDANAIAAEEVFRNRPRLQSVESIQKMHDPDNVVKTISLKDYTKYVA